MPNPLFVLILENDIADFELITQELDRLGLAAQYRRVDTEQDFIARLKDMPDIIILADYSLAGFDALRALELLQERGLTIPFIVLTCAVSEDRVVECMKRGAADYLLKDRIIRLGPAVLRALEEGKLRCQTLEAEQAIRQKNVELEELYRQAQSASRMKSIFLANMSHELRTPLNAVIGFAEILVDGKVGVLTAEQLDFTQEILGNGKHLLGLINDVLDLAQVESGRMPMRPEQVCLPDLIRESVGGLRVLAAERQVVLEADVHLAAIEVFLDPQKLKQVLLNFLSNALKFTPAGGKITVRTRLGEDSLLRLEVEDTGNGIAQEDLKLLFQDFRQLNGGLLKQVQGTGLGLALTKRLVEAQGGKVGAVSVPGKGTTLFADLPCSPDWMKSDLEALSGATSRAPAAVPHSTGAVH